MPRALRSAVAMARSPGRAGSAPSHAPRTRRDPQGRAIRGPLLAGPLFPLAPSQLPGSNCLEEFKVFPLVSAPMLFLGFGFQGSQSCPPLLERGGLSRAGAAGPLPRPRRGFAMEGVPSRRFFVPDFKYDGVGFQIVLGGGSALPSLLPLCPPFSFLRRSEFKGCHLVDKSGESTCGTRGSAAGALPGFAYKSPCPYHSHVSCACFLTPSFFSRTFPFFFHDRLSILSSQSFYPFFSFPILHLLIRSLNIG